MRRRILTVTSAIALSAGLALGAASDGAAAPPGVADSPGAVSPAAPASIPIRAADPVTAIPTMTVTTHLRGLAPGAIFTGPKFDGAHPLSSPVGIEISDSYGRPIYFDRLPGGPLRATDVQEQLYRGKTVLTYWKGGTAKNALGVGVGTDYIVDQHYHVIKRVHSHAKQMADLHEFTLTDHDTALVDSYQRVRADARAEGGAKNQLVFDCVLQEIDLRTSKVVFEWHSIRHVPLFRSHVPAPRNADGGLAPNVPYDYFHLNAAKYDTDGNILISSRHTWGIYKVNRKTGKIIWVLGSKHSSFTFGPRSTFAWQHDIEPVGHKLYRIFDNEWNLVPGQKRRRVSRVLWVQVNTSTHHATFKREIVYPGDRLISGAQGNSEPLPNGNTFVGWGSANRVTEFGKGGRMLFSAQFSNGMNTYRAFRNRWAGKPLYGPSLTRHGNQFDVVWNGATGIGRWRILGGSSPSKLHVVGSTGWRGLDTGFTMPFIPMYLQATAIRPNHTRIRKTHIIKTS